MKTSTQGEDKASASQPSWCEATTTKARLRLVRKVRQERQSALSGLGTFALVAALCVLPPLLLIAMPMFPIAIALILLVLLGLPRFVTWSLVPLLVLLLALAWRRSANRRRSGFYKNPAAALDEYKRVLAGLLPQDFLTQDGFLKGHDGKPEPICIVTSNGSSAIGFKETPDDPIYDASAGFSGGLPYKPLRRRLERVRDTLPEDEYCALKRFVDKSLKHFGTEDKIDIRSGRDEGTLAHEAFHDIQGFLYDNHPEIIDALQQACIDRQDTISAWHKDPDSRTWTEGGYQLRHIFPETVDDVPYHIGVLLEPAILFLDDALQHRDISAVAWESVLIESHKDLGRLEAIPLMISAAACGNEGARAILRDVLGDAGLKSGLFAASVESKP